MSIVFAAVSWLVQLPPIDQALVGSWQGSLQYRDYRSDRLVTLPTHLTITSTGSGSLSFAYTYDDGPGKIVRSQESVTIDSSKATYRIQSGVDYDGTFSIEGLSSTRSEAPQFTLVGRGDENGAPVDLRIAFTITPSSLTMRRDSRAAGGEWRFRNEYRLTR